MFEGLKVQDEGNSEKLFGRTKLIKCSFYLKDPVKLYMVYKIEVYSTDVLHLEIRFIVYLCA